MPRLIDADALPHDFTVPWLMDSRAYFKGVQDVFNTLDATPTVEAVAVVRCRECVNRNTPDCPLAYAVQWGIGNDEPSDDEFCSYGERKEPDA